MWPNWTAPSIISSDNSFASDSTIKTPLFVPETTKSNSLSFNSSLVGFKINSPSEKPTLAAAMGPRKGKPAIVAAADAPIIEQIAGSFSPS